MNANVFEKRVRAICKDFEVSSYREGPDGSIDGIESPWVEFYLRANDRGLCSNLSTDIPFSLLKKFAFLFGTESVKVTGWDAAVLDCCCQKDEHDHLAYIVAHAVKFPKGKR